MVAQRLVLEALEEDEYELIAIHCAVPSYKLAFLLNKHLRLHFCRKKKDVCFEYASVSATYPYYQYIDENNYTEYNLVKNTFHTNIMGANTQQDLFGDTSRITKYLMPEHKSVDYFLKIITETPDFSVKNLVSRILQVPQIITAYSINKTQIKSKNNLIFE